MADTASPSDSRAMRTIGIGSPARGELRRDAGAELVRAPAVPASAPVPDQVRADGVEEGIRLGHGAVARHAVAGDAIVHGVRLDPQSAAVAALQGDAETEAGHGDARELVA